jgi:pimeloyl-ACP methyl ester carboxylesterase
MPFLAGRQPARGTSTGRRWRVRAAAACVLAVATTGCTGGSPNSSGPSRSGTAGPAPRLVLSDCPKDLQPDPVAGQPGDPVAVGPGGSVGRQLSYACGTLAVPVDPAKPDGPTLPMFVLRIRMAGQSDRIGSLVLNPGGPGASGVEDATHNLVGRLPEDVLRRFDLVSFDPRGVGRSDPVRCAPTKPTTTPSAGGGPHAGADDGYNAALAEAVRVANSCYAKYGDRLATYNTTAVAHDMELLRQALGEPKLTYLGYSYGTLLGAVYATLYPHRVRAFVLDAAVDPAAGELSNQEDQARGMEDAYDRFAAYCVRLSCPLGRDPRAFLTRLLAKAKAAPIPSRSGHPQRRASDEAVLDVVSSAQYVQGWWAYLVPALDAANRGDAGPLLALRDQMNGPQDPHDNFEDAFWTIRCVDKRDRITETQVRSALADWPARYPLFGKDQALSLLGCQQWKAPQKPPPAVHAPTAAPILVVGTRHDPAAPYAWAQRMQAVLGNATLLTWDSDGHTAYPLNNCINDTVDRYLISGAIPSPERTCPAN